MKAIIDTNVIYLSKTPISDFPVEILGCARKCNHFLDNFLGSSNPQIVLDRGKKIYTEYRNAYLQLKNSAPNMATRFCKWLFHYINIIPDEDFIELPLNGNGEYIDFPDDIRLKTFDLSDRKFIALAKKHSEHPTIIEGADCKWWGFREALADLGIKVTFIDEDYIKMKYKQKMG